MLCLFAVMVRFSVGVIRYDRLEELFGNGNGMQCLIVVEGLCNGLNGLMCMVF